MRSFYSFILGFFLLAVWAEKEDVQGHHTEQTKDKTVTKDLLWKQGNTIGHGREAIPTENAQRHSAVSVTAKNPKVYLFDTGPTPSFEETQIPKASGIIASMSSLISSNGRNALKSTGDNSSAMRIHNESETPLIPNYDRIVFSSTQAAFESIMNGTSEPEAYQSAVNASLWLHTLLDNRNQRNTVSNTLTSADRGPEIPTLSASHPRVIDNLAVLRNDNDDKRSLGKEKGISNLGRDEFPFGTTQSIFQSNAAKDSVRGSTMTNLCLTCQKDRRAVSTQESTALPTLSPDGSSVALSIEGLALDFREFTTLSLSLYPESMGEQEDMLNGDILQENIAMYSPSKELVNDWPFPPSTHNKTVNHNQNILNYSQINVTETVAINTLVKLSSEWPDTKKQSQHNFPRGTLGTQRPISTNTALYHSSKFLHVGSKREMLGKEVRMGDPQSKNKHNENASLSFVVQNRSLDISNGSGRKTAEEPHSSQNSVPPHSADHSAASHPTVRRDLIEAHSTVASFSPSRPTTSAVKNAEPHFLTGRTDSLISVLRSQTPAKPGTATTRPILTLLPKNSDVSLSSVTTKRYLADKQDSQTVNTVNSIIEQHFDDPTRPTKKPDLKKLQTPTLAIRKVVPIMLFLSESTQDFKDDVFMSAQRTPSSESFTERLTTSRLLESKSKITQQKMFDVSSDKHVAPSLRSFVKYSRDTNRDPLMVHNVKPRDKNEQVAAEDEDKEIIKTEGRQGQVIKETKEALKLQEDKESRNGEDLEKKIEYLFRSDTLESVKQKKKMKTGVEINHTNHKEDKIEEHEAKTSREEVGGTIREEGVTLREEKDIRKVEVRDKDEAEEQRVYLTKEGGEAGGEEAESKGDIKHNREKGRNNVTNVPRGTTANSKELNRDKGHTITELSSCHSLIKQFGAPEQKGVRPGENTAQIREMKNKPFSYEVTSNHRPLHSTLRSHSPNLSRMTSLPKEPDTQIKPHLSTHRLVLTQHGATKESSQNKAIHAMFSATEKPKTTLKSFKALGVTTSKLRGELKPTISPHSGTTYSAHPVLKSNSKMSVITPPSAIKAELLRTQQHFAVNTLNASIIYSISDRRSEFSTLDSREDSLSQTMNERHILQTSTVETGVKDPLTSNMVGVNTSTSVNLAPSLQMNNDSSARPPTVTALSSVAHSSIGRPHQRQSAPEISQSTSSSFDMSSGQPCSFKLLEQTAHSDALHAPVDDNEQRSVQTLMTLMSPKAKNDQFPLSSVSPLPNRMLPEDDSLPGTYSLTGLTRSAPEKEILRANADAEYANSRSGPAESLLGTAEAKNQTGAHDSVQKTVTSGVKHSYVVTKQTAESRDERKSSSFMEQTIGRSHASNTEEFNSVSLLQTEKLAVGNTNEDNHNDLFNVDAGNTVKTTLKNHLSQSGAYNETSAQPVMSTIQTSHKIEQAINEDFVPVTNDFAVPVLDTNDQTGIGAFVKSEGPPEITPKQANDVTSNAISNMKHHTAATKKQHDRSPLQVAPPVLHIHFGSDLKVHNIPTQQIADRIMNVTSDFPISTETNDYMSLAPTPSASGLIVSTEAHESVLTTNEHIQVASEESSQAAQAERMVQSDIHIEPLSLRESPSTVATHKLTPAVNRKNTLQTQSGEQSEREISVQMIEQNQHAPPDVTTVPHPTNDPGQSGQEDLVKAAHRAGEYSASTVAERVVYSSYKDIKTTPSAKSALEAKLPLHEMTPTVIALDGTDEHKKRTLHENFSVSQVILGAVTRSVPPMVISPTEISDKTSCRTIGCVKSGERSETTIGAGEIDHTAREKMYKTQAGNTGGDHFDAAHTPETKAENGNGNSDRPAPERATPQATSIDYMPLSTATAKSDRDLPTVEGTTTKSAISVTDETSTGTRRGLVETDHLERHGELEQFVEKTTQRHFHSQTSKAQEAAAAEVTSSEPEDTTAQNTEKTSEQEVHREKKIKTQLNRGAVKAVIFEAQKATRSARSVAEGETAAQESDRTLLLLEPESESELPGMKPRRRTSPDLYLSGITEVSDDLCGTGNYTAEMSLNLGRGVEPGDAVPVPASLRVDINLKTNNSRINLEITSCCLSPAIQPDLTNSTCCLFSRLAAEPAGITLLPSALSTGASFTISLFQMINYSVVYLHCDLSVCLRNRSDCERRCLQQRNAFPLEGPEAIVTNLRNRISFGPLLKEVKNSTFPEKIDPSELNLVVVIISLVAGSSLVTVTLLLVWLAYRRRAIWLLSSAAPPRACCGCLHPGGDLILP